MNSTIQGIELSSEQTKADLTVSEPVPDTQGPYWQMVYYAVSGFFFW
jgi:hypothetical protein